MKRIALLGTMIVALAAGSAFAFTGASQTKPAAKTTATTGSSSTMAKAKHHKRRHHRRKKTASTVTSTAKPKSK